MLCFFMLSDDITFGSHFYHLNKRMQMFLRHELTGNAWAAFRRLMDLVGKA